MMEKLSAEKFDLNFEYVKNTIASSAKKSLRNINDIIILAATKTVDTETINYAIKSGINYIGERYSGTSTFYHFKNND